MPGTPQPAPKHSASDPGSAVGSPGTPEGSRPTDGAPLAISSFVGREREIAEVGAMLLGGTRLITLTGPGGTGKTRLASAVAFESVGSFEDGAWWVELASLSDPDLAPQSVATVLNVAEAPGRSLTEAVAEDLGDLEILLVLDNCEHLVGACARLAETLLRSCPGLAILATSREPLEVGGERLFHVPPLSFPDPRGVGTPEDIARYEAVRLFVDRARAVVPSFGLSEANASAVAKVCRTLDGIPLAIELAASRTRVLSIEEISSRLEGSFALLSGGSRTAEPRQRTLRAAMDWSHDLLSEEEKVLFRRLSVFAGGFTLKAAEGVCAGEGIEPAEVLEVLSDLVAKSLVTVAEREGAARYGLLETVGQYASEKLEGSGEAERVSEQHTRHYLALAEEAERGLGGPDRLRWLALLEGEHDNLRAALRRSLEGPDEEPLGLRLAAALWPFWYTHGHLSEGRRWIERAVSGHSPTTSRRKAQALNGAGYMALFQGDYEAARGFLERSLALYRGLADDEGIASSLIYLGFVAVLGERDLDTVPALYREAAGLGPELKDPRVVANLTLFSGLVAASQDEMERATALNEEALALFRRLGDIQGVGQCLTNLALLAVIRADYDRASTFLRENLRMASEADYKLAIQFSLLGFGLVAVSREQPERAARLWGAEEAMEELLDTRITPLARSRTNYEGRLAEARSRLGDEAFAAAWAEGRGMTQEHAVEYALSTQQVAPASLENTGASPLSARETEVLALVAEGLTNPQIAHRLYLSPRTVGQHLRSVYRKLGVSSRAAAVREAHERGPL